MFFHNTSNNDQFQLFYLPFKVFEVIISTSKSTHTNVPLKTDLSREIKREVLYLPQKCLKLWGSLSHYALHKLWKSSLKLTGMERWPYAVQVQNIKYLERAVNELMAGVLIRSDTQLNPVKKRRSFGSGTGIKPQELRFKTKAVERPLKVCLRCLSAENDRTSPHLDQMLKETRLLQSVSNKKWWMCIQMFILSDEPDKTLLENITREE